jgi:hypothetical protein
VVAALRQTAFQLGVAIAVSAALSVAASHTAAVLAAPRPPSQPEALRAGYQLALLACAALAAGGGLVTLMTLRRRAS